MTHFVRHSVKIGKYSRFVAYERTSNYVFRKVVGFLLAIIILIPVLIVHYVPGVILKLLINGVITFVYWIKGRVNPVYAEENDAKLERIYESVDRIVKVVSILIDIAVVVLCIYLISVYMDNRNTEKNAANEQYTAEQVDQSDTDGKSKSEKASDTNNDTPSVSTKAFISDLSALIKQNGSSLSKTSKSYIKMNKKLFPALSKKTIKKKTKTTLNYKSFSRNAKNYKNKLVHLKSVKVAGALFYDNITEIVTTSTEGYSVEREGHIYMPGTAEVTEGDKISVYVYVNSQKKKVEEAGANNGWVDKSYYTDHVIGCFIG